MQIELTRIHAINWFGYQDVFDVAGNLLIAGVTGSGKSILMDLVQLVLIGDQKSKYNQSATGKASSRTLKSYCLGDTKDEIEGVAQYMRNEGATTYAALEFTRPDGNIETWGLRVEFDSAAQNQASKRHGFFINGRMNKEDWIDGFDYPLDWAVFREMVHDGGGKVFDTMDGYRREMSLVKHLNFDRETLDYLLPAAMSFTFLDNFNKFCKNYVLPPDQVHIQEVRDSYHAFLSLRRELSSMKHQLTLLDQIHTNYTSHKQALNDRNIFADIGRDMKVEELRETVDELLHEIKELEEKAKLQGDEETTLENTLATGRSRRDLLRDALNETEEGRLFLHIREDNRNLVNKLQHLREATQSIEEARRKRCQAVRSWMETTIQTRIKIPAIQVSKLKKALNDIEQCDLTNLTNITSLLEKLAEAVREFHTAAKEAEKPLRDEVEKKVRAIRNLTSRLESLDNGRLNHRSALLDSINSTLPRRSNGEPAAYALRELCEVTDERWRPALETSFSRKFAVVVDPGNYKHAETIYREMKGAAPGESLINPEQALEIRATRLKGSLAEHLECESPVAQAIVNHLFGRIICVEKAADLTKHDAAILPDGFSYRRPFAERRAHYDNIPCIGGKGLEQQKIQLEKDRQIIRKELDQLMPTAQLLEQADATYRREKLDNPSLGPKLINLHQLEDYETRLQENIERLKAIEGSDFEAKEAELRDLDHELTSIETKLKSLRKSEIKVELGRIQGQLLDSEEQLERAEEELSRYRAEGPNIDAHSQRREELVQRIITEFPAIDIAVSQAVRLERVSAERAITSWASVVDGRKELSREFPIYNEFSPEEEDNSIWEERLKRIESSEIPAYEKKAQREETNWQEIFRKQVLIKLRSALMKVDLTLKTLNKQLKKPIGHHLYQIRKRSNPDYKIYQKLIDNSMVDEEDSLFFDSVNEESKTEIERIFTALVEDPNNAEALNFLDYRNYYDYDMSVMDTRDSDARETSVDRQSGKFSGGESQSPYFIAILACYLRAYHRYDQRDNEPSIGIVPIDEAFSKLSGERIRDCIEALKSLGLQGVFSMSSGNIPYAMDLCDQTMVVSKKEIKKDNRTSIRNIAVSLTREEAINRLVGAS